MRDIDWKTIQVLYSHRNMTKTAQLLFCTQPALTKRIQQIEFELGIQLVTRSTKGIVFTAEGEFVAQKANEILAIRGNIDDRLIEVKNGNAGIVRIACSESYARISLPGILKGFHEKYPDIEFQVISDFSDNVIKLVQERRCHVGFIRGDLSAEDLVKRLIIIDQGIIASRTPIAMTGLPRLAQVDYVKSYAIQRLIDLWWNERFEEPPNIRFWVNNGATCREMVLGGLGYSILFIPEFNNEVDFYVYPLFMLDGTPLFRNTWIIYGEECAEIAPVRKLLEHIESVYPTIEK